MKQKFSKKNSQNAIDKTANAAASATQLHMFLQESHMYSTCALHNSPF